MRRHLLALFAGLLGAPALVHAQTAATDSTRPAPDSASAAKQVSGGPNMLRASWLSDRQPIRVGDLLTIVVDEQTSANEQMSTIATGNRSHNARLGIGVDSAVRIGPSNSSRPVSRLHHGTWARLLARETWSLSSACTSPVSTPPVTRRSKGTRR